MQTFFLGVGFGLVTASVLAISAVALTLQFSVTDVPESCGLGGETMSVVVLEFRGFTV